MATAQPFVWGPGGARMTPEQIAAQKKVAQALMEKGGDYSPVQSPWQGAARVAQALYGGFEDGMADRASAENAKANQEMIAALLAGGGAAPPAMSGGASAPAAAMAPTPMVPSTAGKIYEADEPSPLDPPSGGDREAMIRTILGEAGNQPAVGQNAVASVIRNRAVAGNFGGDTPTGVVTARNQFEPWNTQDGRSRMAAAASDPANRAAADAAIADAYGEGGRAPNDPTMGATHFFAPKAQAALGRQVPTWGRGQGQDIADHRFFGSPVQQVAIADDALPPNATPTQAQPRAPQAASPFAGVNPRVIEAATSQYSSPQVKAIANMMLQQQLQANKPTDYDIQQRPDGTVIAVNKKNPNDLRVLDAPGAGAAAIKFEADKAAAVATAKSAAEKAVAAPERRAQELQVASIVTQDVDRALELIDRSPKMTTGMVGPWLSKIGGTDAANVSKLIDTVKANAGFAELQKMRNNSPTGGALGQVSERELAYLQSTIGSMEQSQDADQLKDNLRRVKNTYMDIIHGPGKGPPRDKLQFEERNVVPSINDIDAELKRRGLR